MNHGVVYWPVTGVENTSVAEQLTMVTNALLDLYYHEWPTEAPKLYFTDGSYPYQWYKRGGNAKMPVWGVGHWFATVISDEPITQEQADELIAEFFKPPEEETDTNQGDNEHGPTQGNV